MDTETGKAKKRSSPRRPWLSWRPTSSNLLAHAERRMLEAGIGEGRYKQQMVDVGDGQQISTLIAGRGSPLVIMHGFASGIGLFVCNIKELARHHKVYALDMIGFGRSSRPKMRFKTPEQSEDFFLGYFEAWRQAMQLERFTLIGHSLGGYLSSLYTIRHPQRIEHLILADVWGILPKPEEEEEFAGKWRLIKTSLNHFTPLAPLRFAGPFGPNIIHKLRPDMMEKFAHLFPGDAAAKELEMVDMSGKKANNNKTKTKKKAKKKERREKKNEENEDEEEQRCDEQKEKKKMKKKKKEKEKECDDDDNENEKEQGEEEADAEAEQHREEQRAEAEWEMVEEGMMQEDAVKGLGKEAKISSRVVIDYIYHINARTPATGEIAFRKLLIPINWPAKPLAERFASIDPSIPLTFLFGTHSWIDPTGMFMLQETLPNDIEVIPIHNSGHHLYVDNIAEFNGAILTSMAQHKRKRAERDAADNHATDAKEPRRRRSSEDNKRGSDTEDSDLEREVDEFVTIER